MKKTMLALTLLAALPFAANAADPLNYTYVEGGYANVDSDADGAYLRASYNFGQTGLYGFGEYARVEIDNTNFDVNMSEVGLGYHHSLSNRTDLLGEVSYNNLDLAGFGDVDGYRAAAGVRSALAENFNGLAKVNYRDYEFVDGEYSLSLGGEYKFSPRWSISGEVEAGRHDARQLRLGVRASF